MIFGEKNREIARLRGLLEECIAKGKEILAALNSANNTIARVGSRNAEIRLHMTRQQAENDALAETVKRLTEDNDYLTATVALLKADNAELVKCVKDLQMLNRGGH